MTTKRIVLTATLAALFALGGAAPAVAYDLGPGQDGIDRGILEYCNKSQVTSDTYC